MVRRGRGEPSLADFQRDLDKLRENETMVNRGSARDPIANLRAQGIEISDEQLDEYYGKVMADVRSRYPSETGTPRELAEKVAKLGMTPADWWSGGRWTRTGLPCRP